MTALDDALARLRAARGAADRTYAVARDRGRTRAPHGDRRRALVDEAVTRDVLALWRTGRHDTAAIAAAVGVDEARVHRLVRAHRVPA